MFLKGEKKSMQKKLKEQNQIIMEHIDIMINLVAHKLNMQLDLLDSSLLLNEEAILSNRLKSINDLGIVQKHGQEIDILSAKLNAYKLAKRFLLEDENTFELQIDSMIEILSDSLKNNIESMSKQILVNKQWLKYKEYNNINPFGILQHKSLETDITCARLGVFLIIKDFIKNK